MHIAPRIYVDGRAGGMVGTTACEKHDERRSDKNAGIVDKGINASESGNHLAEKFFALPWIDKIGAERL
jgi:hypothetical protein